MNRDDIIRMAIEVGGVDKPEPDSPALAFLERFAALVAAAEREVCAKVCDERASSGEHFIEGYAEAKGCADAIRARGEK